MPAKPRKFATAVGKATQTKQSEAPQADINNMMARFGQTPPRAARQATYGDFSAAMDLKASLDAVMLAEDSYGALPATIRQASGNDPVQLLEMLGTANGIHTLQAAGLDLYDDNGELIPWPDNGTVDDATGLPDTVVEAAPKPPDGGAT